jgi:type IV pilus assembly protein PilV
VGLTEVLVAILVLGIGMLGVAAMQAMTLRNSQGALERSQAVIQTYSILDSMRANRAQAIAGAYNLANAWLLGLKDQLGDSTCGQINCTAAGNCTITVQWDAERGGGTNQQLQTQSAL